VAAPSPDTDLVTVTGMTMAYGDFVVQRDISYSVRRGSVFVVMGNGEDCFASVRSGGEPDQIEQMEGVEDIPG
jgi:ABC-type branched-subunit amino acid transport system ATPase component